MVEYKKFRLGDLFNIHSSAKKFNAHSVKFNGDYPYVARGSSSNGIRGYITENESYLNPAHTLSFGQDTATVYYQDKPYFTGDKIKIFEPKGFALNSKLALYFIVAIRTSFQAYQWGQQSFALDVLNAQEILLPVTSDKKPDFNYMESRIRELERSRIRELERSRIRELEVYLQVSGLSDAALTKADKQALNDFRMGGVRWKPFNINTFFKVLPVQHKMIKRNLSLKGRYLCLSSETTNYGILGYTNNPEFKVDNKKYSYLVFGDHTRTMRILTKSFSVLDNVKVLRAPKMSKEALLFIVAMWHNAIPNLGYARHWTVAKNVNFLLPVTSNDQIDFDFMQTYITAIEKESIKDVITYKDKVISTTKDVITNDY